MMFGPDERAQSTLVGFILLFGILVIAFSSYQAVVVPNQNGEVEFNHFQDIQNDFTEFRSTLVNSVGSNEERAATFRLGTQYPARLLALNPPPVSGQLETIDDGNRKVVVNSTDGENIATDVCGTDTPTTNSLRYTPSYNEFGSPRSVSYENRFVAREFRDGNVYDEQRLIRESSNEINLLLLNGSVSRASQESYSFDINASRRNRTTEAKAVSNIIIPSQYSADEWEGTILEDMEVDAIPNGDGRVRIEAEDGGNLGNYNVSCAAAGLDRDPAFGPSPPSPPSQDSSDNGTDILNPTDVVLDNVERNQNKGNDNYLALTFRSIDSNGTVTDARINFYNAKNQGKTPSNAVLSDNDGNKLADLTVGGEFEKLSSTVEIAEDDQYTFQLSFNGSTGSGNKEWFILTLRFENKSSKQYFVSVPN